MKLMRIKLARRNGEAFFPQISHANVYGESEEPFLSVQRIGTSDAIDAAFLVNVIPAPGRG